MKKKMKLLDYGIWVLVIFLIIYIISPVDLDPLLEFTDNIASLIAMALIFFGVKRR